MMPQALVLHKLKPPYTSLHTESFILNREDSLEETLASHWVQQWLKMSRALPKASLAV